MYTSHGHWVGDVDPCENEPRPRLVARCGGPHVCTTCALEAHRGQHHQSTEE